jgi:hypothetical protein
MPSDSAPAPGGAGTKPFGVVNSKQPLTSPPYPLHRGLHGPWLLHTKKPQRPAWIRILNIQANLHPFQCTKVMCFEIIVTYIDGHTEHPFQCTKVMCFEITVTYINGHTQHRFQCTKVMCFEITVTYIDGLTEHPFQCTKVMCFEITVTYIDGHTEHLIEEIILLVQLQCAVTVEISHFSYLSVLLLRGTLY